MGGCSGGAGRSRLATRGVIDAERGGAGAAVIWWRLLAMADGFMGVQGGALAHFMRHQEAPGRLCPGGTGIAEVGGRGEALASTHCTDSLRGCFAHSPGQAIPEL